MIGEGTRYGSAYLSGAETLRQRRRDHGPNLLVQSFTRHLAFLAVRKRRHEISLALPGAEQSLTEQIVVRPMHRDYADFVIPRHASDRRQRLTRRQLTGENLGAELPRDLLV